MTSVKSCRANVTAVISDATEIAMGAPTSGELKLSNGMRRDNRSPFMVWSDDSEYLAVPQWTQNREQRLMIISMSRFMSRYAVFGQHKPNKALHPGRLTFRMLKGHTHCLTLKEGLE